MASAVARRPIPLGPPVEVSTSRVNKAYQVFDKATGASILGPVSLTTLFSGFGGACQTNGLGEPNVLYDRLADRWFISYSAGTGGTPTDDCVAVSATCPAWGMD